jgi:hypothetical protein
MWGYTQLRDLCSILKNVSSVHRNKRVPKKSLHWTPCPRCGARPASYLMNNEGSPPREKRPDQKYGIHVNLASRLTTPAALYSHLFQTLRLHCVLRRLLSFFNFMFIIPFSLWLICTERQMDVQTLRSQIVLALALVGWTSSLLLEITTIVRNLERIFLLVLNAYPLRYQKLWAKSYSLCLYNGQCLLYERQVSPFTLWLSTVPWKLCRGVESNPWRPVHNQPIYPFNYKYYGFHYEQRVIRM